MWRPGSGIKTGSWNWTVAFCSAASCVSREGKQSSEFCSVNKYTLKALYASYTQ